MAKRINKFKYKKQSIRKGRKVMTMQKHCDYCYKEGLELILCDNCGRLVCIECKKEMRINEYNCYGCSEEKE